MVDFFVCFHNFLLDTWESQKRSHIFSLRAAEIRAQVSHEPFFLHSSAQTSLFGGQTSPKSSHESSYWNLFFHVDEWWWCYHVNVNIIRNWSSKNKLNRKRRSKLTTLFLVFLLTFDPVVFVVVGDAVTERRTAKISNDLRHNYCDLKFNIRSLIEFVSFCAAILVKVLRDHFSIWLFLSINVVGLRAKVYQLFPPLLHILVRETHPWKQSVNRKKERRKQFSVSFTLTNGAAAAGATWVCYFFLKDPLTCRKIYWWKFFINFPRVFFRNEEVYEYVFFKLQIQIVRIAFANIKKCENFIFPKSTVKFLNNTFSRSQFDSPCLICQERLFFFRCLFETH